MPKRVGKYPKAFRQMAVERMRNCQRVGFGAGVGSGGIGRHFPGTRASQRDTRPEASAGGEDSGSRFFQRCLAKSRGSTPERQRLWRDGIYDEIREVMPMQGNLSVERMCQLARASRAGFYHCPSSKPRALVESATCNSVRFRLGATASSYVLVSPAALRIVSHYAQVAKAPSA